MEERFLVPLIQDTVDMSGPLDRYVESPHLQRVAGLVFLMLRVERKVRESFDAGIDLEFIVESRGMSRAEIIAKKLDEVGSPFGFTPNLTRAILEMADNLFGNQYSVDMVRNSPYNNNWSPDPENYLDEVLLQMYLYGRSVHPNRLFPNTFPASDYFDEIFPDDVKRQMEVILDRPR